MSVKAKLNQQKKHFEPRKQNHEPISSESVQVMIASFHLNSDPNDVYEFLRSILYDNRIDLKLDNNSYFKGYVFVYFQNIQRATVFINKRTYYRQKLLDTRIIIDSGQHIQDCLDSAKDPRQIFVTNLPVYYDKKEISYLFDQFGEVVEITIMRNKEKQANIGVITFSDKSATEKAIKSKKVKIDGHGVAFINYAQPKFSKYMLVKIHPDLRKYLKSVSRGENFYNPADFMALQEKVQTSGDSLQCSNKYTKSMLAKVQNCFDKDQKSSNFKNSKNEKNSNNFEKQSRETNENCSSADYKKNLNFKKKIDYRNGKPNKGYRPNTVENTRSNNHVFIENLDSRKNYPKEAQSDQINERKLDFDNQQTYDLQNEQKVEETKVYSSIKPVSDQLNDQIENNLNSKGGELARMNYISDNNTGCYQNQSLQCYDSNRIDDARVCDPQSYLDKNQVYYNQQNSAYNNFYEENYEISDNNYGQQYNYDDRNMNYVNVQDKNTDARNFYNISNDKRHAYNTENYYDQNNANYQQNSNQSFPYNNSDSCTKHNLNSVSNDMQASYYDMYYANNSAYYKANEPNNFIGYQNYTEQGYDPQTSDVEYYYNSSYNYVEESHDDQYLDKDQKNTDGEHQCKKYR